MITIAGFNTSMDKVVELDALRIGDVHRARDVRAYPGGKGLHVATAVAALGEPVSLVGLIDREHRKRFEDTLGARGVTFCGIETEKPIRSCLAIRESSGKITEILEPGPEIGRETHEQMLQSFCERAAASRVAVLSGSLPTGSESTTYGKLVESLGTTRCVVDTSGDPLRHAIAAHPFMVKPNRDEAANWSGAPIDSVEAAARVAQRMGREGIALVVVSLGEQGVLASWRGKFLRASVEINASRNAVGSGDALVGGMVVGLARELSFEETLRLGVACGAANALTDEPGFFHRNDVDRLFPVVKIRALSCAAAEPR